MLELNKEVKFDMTIVQLEHMAGICYMSNLVSYALVLILTFISSFLIVFIINQLSLGSCLILIIIACFTTLFYILTIASSDRKQLEQLKNAIREKFDTVIDISKSLKVDGINLYSNKSSFKTWVASLDSNNSYLPIYKMILDNWKGSNNLNEAANSLMLNIAGNRKRLDTILNSN